MSDVFLESLICYIADVEFATLLIKSVQQRYVMVWGLVRENSFQSGYYASNSEYYAILNLLLFPLNLQLFLLKWKNRTQIQ